MKNRTLILVFLIMAVLIIAGSCATGQKAHVDKRISVDETYGTWVNSDYNEKGQYAKEIDHPDRTYDLYQKLTDTEPTWIGEKTVKDSWYDKEGNLWIKWTIFWDEEKSSYKKTVGGTENSYGLFKFSDSGKVRESVRSAQDHPDEMSPIAGNYAIHYRQ